MTFTEVLSAALIFVLGAGLSAIYFALREARLKSHHIDAIEELRKEFMEIRNDVY